MELQALILHRLNKDSNATTATMDLRNEQLGIKDQTIEFLSRIKDLYYKKSNPYYGNFEANSSLYPFQKYLTNYLRNNLNFVEFTKQSMEKLHSIIQPIPQATGGIVIFAYYTVSEEDFLLTFILNNKTQYNINDELSLEEFIGLDTEKLNVANIINVTKWMNREERHLSFIRGRKELSKYFLEFIGCFEQISAKETTLSLKQAILDFLREKGFEKSKENAIKNEVFVYCRNQIKKNEEISIAFISSLIYPEDPDSFKNFASSENYRISPTFIGNLESIKSLKYYHYSRPDLRIEFDDDLLNNKTIIYDDKANTLLITKVPEDLRKQILNEK